MYSNTVNTGLSESVIGNLLRTSSIFSMFIICMITISISIIVVIVTITLTTTTIVISILLLGPRNV